MLTNSYLNELRYNRPTQMFIFVFSRSSQKSKIKINLPVVIKTNGSQSHRLISSLLTLSKFLAESFIAQLKI